ncbi:MAG: alpha/beta hydrolase [Lacipirellulaceae bacterium]
MTQPAATPTKPRRIGRWLLRIARLLLVPYLLIVLAMALLETRLVYPAPPPAPADWVPPEPQHTDAWADSTDGVRVHGWFYDREDAQRAVLYCHGNAETVADNDPLARTIRDELRADVLVFDYRGYGKTVGAPSEAGIVADGAAAQRWLAAKTRRPIDEVVIVGRSIGGGVATALAADEGAGALVLQDTFTRLTDAASTHYPWLPVRWVMDNRYDSLERIARYRGPVYSSHGALDRVVPIEQGRRLFETAPTQRKAWVEFPRRNHDAALPASYWRDLRGWLEGNAEVAVPNAGSKR